MKRLFILLALSSLAGLIIIIGTTRLSTSSLLRISYLDVGQGDAALITTASGQNILIDCGPNQQILAALSRRLRWWDRRLDMIIVSHDHADHWGGLPYLVNKYPIQQIILAQPPRLSTELAGALNNARQKGIIINNIRAPAVMKLSDNSRLTILWPTSEQLLRYQDNINNQSLVILWQYGQNKFLWTGDLEAVAENELLAQQPTGRPIDILKIAHHGSLTATSLAWLNYWQPKMAVISLSSTNKFGLPSQLIIDRLRRLGIRLWRTDQLNDFDIWSNGQLIWQ
jgi:competence protein ComEC